jgi:hypothetical protein
MPKLLALVAYVALWGAWRAGLWYSGGPEDPNYAGWFMLATLLATIACAVLIRHPAVILLAFVPALLIIGVDSHEEEPILSLVLSLYVVPMLVILTASLSVVAIVSAVHRRGLRARPTRCPRCGRAVPRGAERCNWCLRELDGLAA